MNRDLYAIYDPDPTTSGAIKISPDEAGLKNQLAYGIYQTVNEFSGARRKENLVRINSWFIELDSLTKPEQLELIDSGLIPSMIVESKRGYHVYFDAKDALPPHWDQIMKRLVEFYGADARARDICRILRAPGYKHMKDPADPFEVKVVWSYPVSYTERQMLYFYPPTREEMDGSEAKPIYKPKPVNLSGDGFFERVYQLDCREALSRLSGTRWVNGEAYSFRATTGGRYNILVNGKGTSTWIDSTGKIGSMDKGGPTPYQWLRWYGLSGSDAKKCLLEIFPELAT